MAKLQLQYAGSDGLEDRESLVVPNDHCKPDTSEINFMDAI